MFSVGILNGKIYINGSWLHGNLYIKDDKIAAISGSCLEAATEYDAGGRYVLPGFIDPHVHFALSSGRYTSADNFRTGSISAAFGGITTFIDFIDPVCRADDMEKAYEKRRLLSMDSVIDYGLHATISNPGDDPGVMIKRMKELGMPTAKFFTAYSSSNRSTKDDYLDKMLSASKEGSVMVLVHAENEGIIKEGEGIRVPEHEASRPAASEISEVIKLAEMSRLRDGLLYIVHVSCGTTVERLKEGYGELLGKNIFIESCPHYFTFNSSVYEGDKGGLYTMIPPLRHEKERKSLIKGVKSVYAIATDHCPFNAADKSMEYTTHIPMGIGGVEHSFSLMYSLFGEDIIDKFTKNPAQVHGLYPRKGTLMPGCDADVAIFDPQRQWRVREHNSSCDYIPYEGINLKGRVVSTVSRGRFIVKDGVYQGGLGQYIARERQS